MSVSRMSISSDSSLKGDSREDQLQSARRKLKSYRAKQGKASASVSIASTSTHAAGGSKQRASMSAFPAANHKHRRTLSRSLNASPLPPGSPASSSGHGRRQSASRQSRGGHGHTRSRASLSVSGAAPASSSSSRGAVVAGQLSLLDEDESLQKTPSASDSGLNAPASWSAVGSFPSSPETSTAAPRSAGFGGHQAGASSSTAAAGASSNNLHMRRASRHNRRSSVATRRESLEVMAGGLFPSSISPLGSSFAPERSPTIGFTNDPAAMLERLREEGRRESGEKTEDDLEAERVRALEALEGRVGAPSAMIDLGNSPEGELKVAPPSPGYTDAAGSPTNALHDPTSPRSNNNFAVGSPMVGLGFGSGAGAGGKRSSWSAPGPMTMAGGQGAMHLGALVEEEEEEEEEEDDGRPAHHHKAGSTSSNRSRKGKGSPKRRPASLMIAPSASPNTIIEHDEDADAEDGGDDEEAAPSKPKPVLRPIRLSMSLSNNAAPGSGRRPLSVSLKNFDAATSSPSSSDVPSSSLPSASAATDSSRRRHSHFYTAAATGASAAPVVATIATPAAGFNGGLKSLAIAPPPPSSPPANSLAFPSSTEQSTAQLSRSPVMDRQRVISTGSSSNRPMVTKRSSISYRTSGPSSAITPGAESNTSGARRAYRMSMGSVASPPLSTTSSANPYASLMAGGFGDLVAETTDEEGGGSDAGSAFSASRTQIASLRVQVEHLQREVTNQTTSRAREMADFERKAAEEAHSMRTRIAELEGETDDLRTRAKFEAEGFHMQLEMTKESLEEVTNERDSLREDVEGWRERCASLERLTAKDRDDEALAKAQGKLIGEMRDQIYALVAALEREKGEHAETRLQNERLMAAASVHDLSPSSELDEEAAIGTARHIFGKTSSDVSVLSGSSFGRSYSGNTTEDTSIATDAEDSFSGKMSPNSAQSSFSQSAFSSKGRDSDFGPCVVNTLQTLTEEEEEEDEEGGTTLKEAIVPRTSSNSATSTELSEAMPQTPDKDEPLSHHRSDSFVRQWTFPKGSVTSARNSIEDHTFFNLNRHNSLPPLPISDSILPMFLSGDLSLDEDQLAAIEAARQHARRPSSPRPELQTSAKRLSGQFGKAPPPSPSARAHATINSGSSTASVPSPSKFSRFSFGGLGSLLGSYAASTPSSAAVLAHSGLSTVSGPVAEEDEEEYDDEDDEEAQLFMAPAPTKRSGGGPTPASVLRSSRPTPRYISAANQPRPTASLLSKLDFRAACCESEVTWDL